MRRLWAGLLAGVLGIGVLVGTGGVAHADAVRDSQWIIDALKLAEVHKISTGAGVRVGLVDTGVDSTHPDLTGTVVAGKDAWSSKRDGQSDPVGHGTAMASLIAGHGHGANNGDGILGVAPGAQIVSYGAWRPGDKAYDDNELNAGIRFLLEQNVDVILLAYGGGSGNEDERALIQQAVAKGIPVVTPSGDTAQQDSVGAPGIYPESILVGGTNSAGEYSTSAVADPQIALSAPCEKVNAAWTDHGYSDNSGTSDSAAIVAGLFALIKANWPDITWDDMARRTAKTADDKGNPGRDKYYGFGLINPLKALTAPVDPKDPAHPPHQADDPIYQSAAPSSSALTDGDQSQSRPIWLGVGIIVVLAILIPLVFLARRGRRERSRP